MLVPQLKKKNTKKQKPGLGLLKAHMVLWALPVEVGGEHNRELGGADPGQGHGAHTVP